MTRSTRSKTTGYVLVPLYVELTAGETVAAAVNRAQFDEVWDVLQSVLSGIRWHLPGKKGAPR